MLRTIRGIYGGLGYRLSSTRQPSCSPQNVKHLEDTYSLFYLFWAFWVFKALSPNIRLFVMLIITKVNYKVILKIKKWRYFQYPVPFIFPINTSSLKCNIHSSPQSPDTMVIIHRTATKGLSGGKAKFWLWFWLNVTQTQVFPKSLGKPAADFKTHSCFHFFRSSSVCWLVAISIRLRVYEL